MANGYGGSSSSLITAMRNKTSAQGQTAAAGYHYMPDGTLMSNAEHARLYGEKIIKSFNLDTSDIKAAGEKRRFAIAGDKGAVFSLEIKNGNNYYNFQTNLFQATETKLSNVTIGAGSYTGNITFPKVAAGAQYDVFLYCEINYNTKHAEYIEVRDSDDSININSSTGSNSNLVQKVIYQTLDVTITLNSVSPNSTVTGTIGTQTITTSRNKSIAKIPFSFIFTATSTRTLTINKQPTSSDVLTFVSGTIGATPLDIPGEDIYPAVSDTDTVNGAVTTGSHGTRIVMDNNVADKMAVGDRITTAVTTDTVDGAVAVTKVSKMVMDNNVALKMSVGDAVTGHPDLDRALALGTPFTVAALNPDSDNVKEFSFEGGGGIKILELADGTELTFSSIFNREVITVAALNPDTDNVKEFSHNAFVIVGGPVYNLRDGVRLSFSNQRNFRWPISSTSFDVSKITSGMRTLAGSVFANNPKITEYLEQTTVLEGEIGEYKVDKVRVPALDTFGIKPIISRDGTTKVATTTVGSSTTPVNITFNEQALLSFAGDTAEIYSYGPSEIKRLTDYDLQFSDLAVTLKEVKTTTTSAVSNSTSIPIADRAGVMDAISGISGIGIDTAIVGTDTVNGAISGATKIVMDANVANTMSVGDKVTGSEISPLLTVTVAALNPDGDNVKEFSVSEAINVSDGVTLSFSNQKNTTPTVVSGAGSVTGAGTIVLSATQTLESGVELTFPKAGTIATITGNIKVNKVGNENIDLSFDLEKLLTMH